LPKSPRLTVAESDARLRQAGFDLIRTRGSHRIDKRDQTRVVVPFHSGRTLHPKIVKQVLRAIEGRSGS
jgi:predicted RNA binding protein YcfA (HicA-like mRNA interferase family)